MDVYIAKRRHRISKTPLTMVDAAWDDHFGYYTPERRFSVDQVALEFDVSGRGKTWASASEAVTGQIRIHGAAPGADKRFATINVLLLWRPHTAAAADHGGVARCGPLGGRRVR